MIARPHIAQIFQKIAECLPKKPDWLSRERLAQIVREAVYGPSERRMREDEKESEILAGGMGLVIAADIADGPNEPAPK